MPQPPHASHRRWAYRGARRASAATAAVERSDRDGGAGGGAQRPTTPATAAVTVAAEGTPPRSKRRPTARHVALPPPQCRGSRTAPVIPPVPAALPHESPPGQRPLRYARVWSGPWNPSAAPTSTASPHGGRQGCPPHRKEHALYAAARARGGGHPTRPSHPPQACHECTGIGAPTTLRAMTSPPAWRGRGGARPAAAKPPGRPRRRRRRRRRRHAGARARRPRAQRRHRHRAARPGIRASPRGTAQN